MSKDYPLNLTREEMEQVLKEEETGVLCMADGGIPYAVPLSYAWLPAGIVFHCNHAGKKMDFLKKNSKVNFLVYRHPDQIAFHAEGKCDYRFESILVSGRATIVEDIPQRFQLLTQFQEHFFRRLNLSMESNPITEKVAESCGCVLISVDEMTGRRRAKKIT